MTQEKLDNQRDVVKNERRWRVDNQPYGDWDERLQAMMYPPDHPYHHSVIGSMEDLDAASLEDVEQFFRTYYAPNNAVLSLVGDFDPAMRASRSSATSAHPARPAVPPIPGRTTLPPLLGGEVRDTVEQDISLARVYQAYRIPRTAATTTTPASWSRRTCSATAGRRCCTARWCGSAARAGRGRVRVPHRRRRVDAGALGDGAAGRRRRRAGAALTSRSRRCHVGRRRRRAGDRAHRGAAPADLQTVDERADQLSMYTTLFDDPGRINTELGACAP
jgi:zinc protease